MSKQIKAPDKHLVLFEHVFLRRKITWNIFINSRIRCESERNTNRWRHQTSYMLKVKEQD